MLFADSEISSTGAFLIGELERLDTTLYEPIADFTWSRDIDIRDDVTISDEVTSFITSIYTGGFGGTGSGTKSWIKGNTTTPAQIGVEGKKHSVPLTPWGMELAYDIIELQKAMRVGRPIDVQKYEAMRFKHQLDIDQMVYLGDADVGHKGLLNNDAQVTPIDVGAFSGSTTPDKIITFFNNILKTAWEKTQFTRMPDTLLLPPELFAALASKQLPNTSMNMLNYVESNNLVVSNGGHVTIRPCKYLGEIGASGSPRIVAYTKSKDVVRFPLVQLQSMPVQFRSFQQCVPYYGALGVVEFVRPEMVTYADLK